MKRKPKFLKRALRIGIILAVLAIIILVFRNMAATQMAANLKATATATTEEAKTRDIETVLSSSGTIKPLASYNVTTLVSGEIIAADFEEGDIVQEGQVLYQIATDNLDSNISTAETTLHRAKKEYTKAEKKYQEALGDYDDAQEDYKKAVSEYSNINVLSTATGIVTKVYVKEGDTIQAGSQIADVYDNSRMVLTVPFNASEVSSDLVGRTAVISLDDTFETLKGKVTKVSNTQKALTGNRVVRDVTIEVENPGGITDATMAGASIEDYYYSMDSGTFAPKTNTTITSDLAGKIAYLNIEENEAVKEDGIVLSISQDTVDDKLKSYQDAIDLAQDAIDNAKDTLESRQEAIEDAQSSLQDVIDNRTDYSITSPITGKVIAKNSLKGDTVNAGAIGTSSLCTIYDLSAVTFDMNVDELDVLKVKEGQTVKVTADALEGTIITGTITNISLESSSSQGVTQYPVTVRIDAAGELLPVMNVTGEIVVEKAAGVLAIPSDALQRGNLVYVADASVTEAEGEVPAGYRAVEVTTGISDGSYIEIRSGLSEGDIVYVKRPEGLSGLESMIFGVEGQSGETSGGGSGQPGGPAGATSR